MLGSTNGWAVGDDPADDPTDNTATIIHWDGVQWRRVPGPDIGNAGFLAKVFLVSDNDGWAVGYKPGSESFIVRWDGITWDVISTPPIPPTLSMQLNSLYMVSSLEGWAVGGYEYEEFDDQKNPDCGADGIILRYGPDTVIISTTGTVTSTVSTTTTQTATTTTHITSETTTTTTPPGQWGIPGFPIESILAGLAGGAAALALIRRRRNMRS